MRLTDALRSLRSIRKYQDKQVEPEKLQSVFEHARLAPSALNKQPWSFILVSDPDTIDKINYACNQTWFTPHMIVGCVDPAESFVREDGEGYWKMDLALAMHNLMLAASAEGLGTCWVVAFNEKDIKKFLDIPHYLRVLAITPIGYPDEKKRKITKRKKLEEILFYEKWGHKEQPQG